MIYKILFCLFGVLFVSCAKIPTNSELISSVPDSFSNADLVNTSNNVLFMQPKEQLYHLFNDDVLRNLYDISLDKNINLQIMQSRILQAESQLKTAFSELFPSVNGSVSSTRDKNSNQFQTQIGTSVSWELDIFGKNRYATSSRDSIYKKTQEELRASQITLLADITSLYFNLYEYYLNIALTQDNIIHYEILLELTKMKVDNGLLDSNELFLKQDLLSNEQNSLEILKKQFEETKNSLLILLNLKKLPFAINSDFKYKEDFEFSFNNIPSEAILLRPDIRANILMLYSQIYNKQEAFASLFPVISIGGNLNEILSSNNSDIAWSIVGSISAPILNRTKITQNYLLQNEILNETYLNLQSSINTAFFEIENALYGFNSSKLQNNNNIARFKNSQEYFNFSSNKRNAGLIDELEFQENYTSFNNAKKSLNSSRNSQIQALIVMFRTFGGNLYIGKDN